jgi:enoyl-CoA hydratase/carnithine racemase
MSEHMKIGVADGIMEIRFARTEKKNAISLAMYRAATDALESAETRKDVRVVLFSAEGEIFTAGNDLGDFAAVAKGGPELEGGRFIEALATAKKPLVAAVQGPAIGIGATMLLHCDLVFLAETARISTPFVNLALVPEAGSSLLMPLRIGHARAFAMFALGEPISAQEALAFGLANAVVPAGKLAETARAACRKLAARPLGSVMATKALMRDAETILTQSRREGARFGERLLTAEAAEAFAAFFEKRAPDFSRLG